MIGRPRDGLQGSQKHSNTPRPSPRISLSPDFHIPISKTSFPSHCINAVVSMSRPVLKGFLPLTPPSPKSPASPPLSNEVFTPAREHRGSTSSESSITSDVGENGFLVLTAAETVAVEMGLGKIVEEEAVE